jgi:hypothetical protein
MGTEPLGLGLTALQLVYALTDTGAVSSCLQAYINYTRKCFPRESVFAVARAYISPTVVHYQTSIWINGVKAQT